jgi:hypothetical protein
MKRIITHNENSEPCNASARMLRGQGHPVKLWYWGFFWSLEAQRS